LLFDVYLVSTLATTSETNTDMDISSIFVESTTDYKYHDDYNRAEEILHLAYWSLHWHHCLPQTLYLGTNKRWHKAKEVEVEQLEVEAVEEQQAAEVSEAVEVEQLEPEVSETKRDISSNKLRMFYQKASYYRFFD
jgi:hypothetical protein